jgi:predicted ATP-grasp superfamily ATP-dependent carboligase
MGLVGIDLVVDPAGGPHVLEVNPRPTASMELFERSGAVRLAADHLAACGVELPRPAGAAAAPPADVTWAKAVLFARREIPVDAPLLARLAALARPWTAADGGWPAVADIPRPEQMLAAGSPVVSIFARGDGTAETVAALRDRVAAVHRLVAG